MLPSRPLSNDVPQWSVAIGDAVTKQFYIVCVCFGINHATVTTPIGYATSALGSSIGNITLGTLYLLSIFSSLFLGAPSVAYLGSIRALMIAFGLYVVYVICFGTAVAYMGSAVVAPFGSNVLAMVGSVCGGLAVGSLWTAQGVMFSEAAQAVARYYNEEPAVTNARFAGNFGTIYLSTEVAFKFGSSSLLKLVESYGPVAQGLVFCAYGVLGFACLVCIYFVGETVEHTVKRMSQQVGIFDSTEMGNNSGMVNGSNEAGSEILLREHQAYLREKEESRTQTAEGGRAMWTKKLFAALNLWTDPKIWMIGMVNFSFGVAAVLMNGWVNANLTTPEIGKEWIGFLSGITSLTAAASTAIYGRIQNNTIPLAIASTLYILLPILILCNVLRGWFLIILYIMGGMGRGVYESSNKAVFAEFYAGPTKDGAFANVMIQNCMITSFFFFINSSLTANTIKWEMTITLFVLALTIVPLNFMAKKTLEQEKAKSREQLLAASGGIEITANNKF